MRANKWGLFPEKTRWRLSAWLEIAHINCTPHLPRWVVKWGVLSHIYSVSFSSFSGISISYFLSKSSIASSSNRLLGIRVWAASWLNNGISSFLSDEVNRVRYFKYGSAMASTSCNGRNHSLGWMEWRDWALLSQGKAWTSAHGDWRSEERRVGKECRSRWSPYH